MADCRKRMNLSPLGCAAMAGTGLPIDREQVAGLLGFDGVTANSMDTAGDRDFAIEFVSCCTLIQLHLSRLSEELVLWSSQEFSFVDIADAFCTGSSIMPQKKNPDIPELIRGKSGRVVGSLMTLITLVKGLPLTYNRDLQEDKEPVFDAVDTVTASLVDYGGTSAKPAIQDGSNGGGHPLWLHDRHRSCRLSGLKRCSFSGGSWYCRAGGGLLSWQRM